jgi:hypothetical protein
MNTPSTYIWLFVVRFQAQLSNPDDHVTKVKLTFWAGNIMDPNVGSLYSFQMKCGEQYPQRFVSRSLSPGVVFAFLLVTSISFVKFVLCTAH